MCTFFTEIFPEDSIVINDGVNTQYSDVNCYPTAFKDTAETRRALRESRMTEMGSLPFQGVNRSEAASYLNYMNTALCHVDQLRYPENLPNISKSANGHEAGRQENSMMHGSSGEHSGSFGHEAHGDHETKKHFIEGTHTTEGIFKSLEEIGRIAQAERSTVSIVETLETSAAELDEASTISRSASNSALGRTVQNTALPENASTARPMLEAAKAPLKEPITWEMQQYVDAVRESKVAEAGPRTAPPNASSVTAEAGTAHLSAGTKPSSALAAESSEAGHALHGAGHSGKFHKVMGTAEKALAPAAVLAGGLEIAHGISELRHGETVLGSFDVAGGAAGVTGGAAATVNAFGLATAPATAAALGTVAGVGFGAVAVIDGAKTIYQGIKEKDTEKTVVGGVKTAAGGAMIAGVCTANPVLIVGGAATYAGAVIYENREAIADGARKACNYTADKVGQGVEATKQFAGNVAHSISAKAQSIKSEAGALIDAGMQKAGELKDAGVQKAVEIKMP